MSMEQIIGAVRDLDGALVVIPGAGRATRPSWRGGTRSSTSRPTAVMPQHVQPYGTIVTKDYPDDTASELDARGSLAGERARRPRELPPAHGGRKHASLTRARDHRGRPTWCCPHPVYGALGWVAVVNPGEETTETVLQLLRDGHRAARARVERRQGNGRAAAGGRVKGSGCRRRCPMSAGERRRGRLSGAATGSRLAGTGSGRRDVCVHGIRWYRSTEVPKIRDRSTEGSGTERLLLNAWRASGAHSSALATLSRWMTIACHARGKAPAKGNPGCRDPWWWTWRT